MLADPEAFFQPFSGRRLVLDEIHRLANPSETLKIAADHFPDIRIIATGSSSLAASTKFRDTLTGRKTELWLTPMILNDLADFERTDLEHRLLRGGIPPFFLSGAYPEAEFQEWMDSYWAKDIQELFRLERRHSFQRFVELLLTRSGGIFEATRFAGPCEISRTTIANYLAVLEATYVAHVIRPFNSGSSAEIISAPKVFGFDTGFVCYYRGWSALHPESRGLLWEHVVLNELQAGLQRRSIHYWRDKRGHELDFVLADRGQPPTAIECKLSPDEFNPAGLKAFRHRYPHGDSFVVAPDIESPFLRRFGPVEATFVSLPELIRKLFAPDDSQGEDH